MPTTQQEERWRWIRPIINKEMTYTQVLKVCPHSKRTLEYWVARYRRDGMQGLTPVSTRPKHSPQRTPAEVREQVLALRKKTGLCAQKLHWRLEKQGLSVPVRTIGKILKEHGMTRVYRKRKTRYRYMKQVLFPRDMVEIDVKYVPQEIERRQYFQYTAIDCASRWRFMDIYEVQASWHSVSFLKNTMKRFPITITAIKTDNHSTFTNYYCGTNKRSDMTVKRIHQLDVFCREQNIIHYLIDPGKPAQNGTVERSHREDEEKFYQKNTFLSLGDLKRKIRIWNKHYNNLEHCSLNGKTPNEVLQLLQLQNPQKVLA